MVSRTNCLKHLFTQLKYSLCLKLLMLLAQNPKVLSRSPIISTKILQIFHDGIPTARLYFRMFLEYRWTSTSVYKELLLIIVPLNAHLYIIICLFDFVKTWPLGFRLAPDAARLQASALSKKVGALTSWPVQLDSPGTALTVGGWIRPGGKINGVGRGLFWHSSLFLLCPGQLNQASAENDYHDNCRAQWEEQKVTHCPGWGKSRFWYQGHT